MNVLEQINVYISSLSEPKQSEMLYLHQRMLLLNPDFKLWFDKGINSENKPIFNPTIGYGLQTLKYAKGNTRDVFQIGISTNLTGISVYILGIKDKKYLAETYAKKIGKASVTGYCIKFKTLKDININILIDAIKYGLEDKK